MLRGLFKNMKNIILKPIFGFALFAFLLLNSCTSNFDELNIDPNRPEKVNPGVILSQLQ
jgi:hypothetical protein